jgi:dTMP kinase
MFITFEGIDGSGKSTQMALLAQTLQEKGYSVLMTRDPGGTEIGQELRKILLHHPGFVSPICELFLYLADRAQHVAEKIRPAIAQGQIVLCDRYVDSTVAYQGGGRGLPIEEIQRMNALATENLLPDRTFLLDAPAEILLNRAKNRSSADRLEQETVHFYEKVREQYLALARDNPKRFVVLDATEPVEAIQQKLLAAFPLESGTPS